MAIITVAHTKGGVGKSMIAWNLAGAFNGTILDLDFQKTLTRNNELRSQFGLKPFKVLDINSPDEFLSAMKKASLSEYIIVDTGGFDDDLTRMANVYANIIITPALENNSELFGLQTFGDILNEIQQQINHEISSYVLINRAHHSSTNFEVIKSVCDSNSKFKLMHTIIRDRGIYRKTFNSAQTVYGSTSAQAKQAKSEINSLKKEIEKRIVDAIKECL